MAPPGPALAVKVPTPATTSTPNLGGASLAAASGTLAAPPSPNYVPASTSAPDDGAAPLPTRYLFPPFSPTY